MRYLILVLVGLLIVACASPTASWRPLNGQDATGVERDWQRCQPTRSPWASVALVLFAPYSSGVAVGDTIATHRCMELAGYEWVGRSPRE